MSYKITIPSNLINSRVDSAIDEENDYAVRLDVKFNFVPELESWFVDYVGELPVIMISRRDFELNGFWVNLSTLEAVSAFKLAWY